MTGSSICGRLAQADRIRLASLGFVWGQTFINELERPAPPVWEMLNVALQTLHQARAGLAVPVKDVCNALLIVEAAYSAAIKIDVARFAPGAEPGRELYQQFVRKVTWRRRLGLGLAATGALAGGLAVWASRQA